MPNQGGGPDSAVLVNTTHAYPLAFGKSGRGLQNELNVELELKDFYLNPTVAGLAKLVFKRLSQNIPS